MSYRILIVNHDYGQFTNQMYHNNQRLARASFAEQHDARMKTFFGVNDYYSSNLCKLGHEAIDIICNNRFMQYAWAVENGLMAKSTDHCEGFIRSLPKEWLDAVFQAQVIKFKPDVIVNLGMASVTSDTLKKIKPGVPLIIGQHASPITPSMQDLSAYDLIVSSLPNLVEYFRDQGKQSTYFRLGFETEILKNIAPVKEKSVDLAFVGGFSTHHLGGAKLFDYLAEQGFSMALYGYGQESLSQKAASFFRGPLFGLGMYDLYASSKIVINRHIDVSGEYANNMRLYEGTGTGALMLTEAKKNLDTLFSPGTEVVAYNSIEECAELARYYLSHDKERSQIALNGQQRTLSEHTYYHRMSDLLGIIEEYSGMAERSAVSSTVNIPNANVPVTKNASVEFEKLKNSLSYTLSGSFDAVLKTIRENLDHFPRRVPGKLNLDGKDFYYADLHSFYYQSMQIFANKIYDFETEVDAPVILDCGAHIGLASIFFASRHPNAMIYAFEADPLIAQMCNENIRSFGLSDRVKVSNQAVWTHKQGIFFSTSCDDSGHIAGDQASEEIRTPSIRLRDIIKDLPIDFIKMDIEGGEFEVLKDCKDVLGNVNKIIAEVHQLGAMPGATSDLLKVLEENSFSYVFDDLHSATWVEEFKKPPFSRLKTDKYYLTVYAWQQSKTPKNQHRTKSILTDNAPA